MGNRAVITTPQKKIGVYLHWNGGRDSIEAFLAYCKLKGYRSPDKDSYGWARLCQVIGNFFGGTSSVGIGAYENQDVDNGDNGTYVIEDWQIVDRLYFEGTEQSAYTLEDCLKGINEKQPKGEQLTEEEINNFLHPKKKQVAVTIQLRIDELDYKTYDKAVQGFLESLDTLENSKIEKIEEKTEEIEND